MRRPGGYLMVAEPGKAEVTTDTFTCGHCNCIVPVQPRQDPASLGGFCRMCMAHICAGCAATGACEPFERKLEGMERTDRLRRAAVV